MGHHYITSMISGSSIGKNKDKDKKKKTKKRRMSTKEHFIEKANIAKYKLKKTASNGNINPWIVGQRYKFMIPEDNFEVGPMLYTVAVLASFC
jgi:hypothetical protein